MPAPVYRPLTEADDARSAEIGAQSYNSTPSPSLSPEERALMRGLFVDGAIVSRLVDGLSSMAPM